MERIFSLIGPVDYEAASVRRLNPIGLNKRLRACRRLFLKSDGPAVTSGRHPSGCATVAR